MYSYTFMMFFILSEFHINPSDEVMYMIKGEMSLHYRTPEGREEVAVIPEGSVIYRIGLNAASKSITALKKNPFSLCQRGLPGIVRDG